MIPTARLLYWIGLAASKFHDWQTRDGLVNKHNTRVPRDSWLEDWEKQAIIHFQRQFPLEGYRRLAFFLLDRDIVAVSPSSVYLVLKEAHLIHPHNGKPSKQGTGV